LGDCPGEHTAYFGAPGERMEIKHVSTTRDSYVLGALRAAKWLADQKPGRYSMADVLGI
jgi:4-hydroxy-tetrahydrodipicolinate reductase